MKKTLAGRALQALALRISVVIACSAILSYYHTDKSLSKKSLSDLEEYVNQRAKRENLLFKAAEDNHSLVKKAFFDRLKSITPQEIDQTLLRLEKKRDGTLRNRLDLYNGAIESGVFVPPNTQLNKYDRKILAVMMEISSQYGRAWHNQFQDTYFTTPNNWMILFWPEASDWTLKLDAKFNMLSEPYVWIADKKNNPDRRTKWTETYFDKVSRVWMVSAETPIDDVSGHHLATIGHDITLDELVNRTLSDYLHGTYNVILTPSGKLIVHPEKSKALQESENYLIKEENDPLLFKQFQAIKDYRPESKIVFEPQTDTYLAIAPLPSPGWIFMTVVPKGIISKMSAEIGIFVGFLGLLSLIVELFFFFRVLKREISIPIREFIEVTEKISGGNFQVRAPTDQQNEIGKLGEAFNTMVEKVQNRDQELSRNSHDLEELVNKRTKELEMARASSLQAAHLASLGEMAGGIAHEINNPLAIIHGKASQLRRIATDGSLNSQLVKDHSEKIVKTTDRIAGIVRGLRSFSRNEENQAMVLVSLQSIVEDALGLCLERFKNAGILLTVDPMPSVSINCRSVQIVQVITNLLSNAYDAVITLPNKWIKIEFSLKEKFLEIAVTDSGHGIEKEIRSKIMQPFFTTKGFGKGTGLGLSISKSIIDQHKGELKLDFQHVNTRFVIRLPTTSNFG